jgi:predicted RNA-binding Zn-ribbon protein involved in translation (DUF1610 family)
MSGAKQWPLDRATVGELVVCPRCASVAVRWTETCQEHGAITITFACTECEQQARLELVTGRTQTEARWTWA